MLTKKGPKFQIPNIKNIRIKFNEIGLDIDFVTRKEELIIFLAYYLGGVTLEQLCFLLGDLETSIRTSISKILRKGEVLELKKNEVNNTFYLPTRKIINELNKFCDVKGNRNYKNIKHLSKVNGFFLILFKSNCEKVTIEYEKKIENEVFAESNVRTDAIINVEKDKNKYEFFLEQDNNTENITRLYQKIHSYCNVILHEKLYTENIRYYYFRFDILFNKNHVAKYEKLIEKSKDYHELITRIDEVQGFYYDVRNGRYPEEYFESRADVYDVEYSEKHNILMKNISYSKSRLTKKLDKLKRTIRLELSSIILRDRINKIKDTMKKEFVVKAFDNDSIDTIYNDIAGRKWYDSIYSRIEGEELLLRTNIIIGDRKTDHILKSLLFGTPNSDEHFLKTIIKGGLSNYGIDSNSLKVRQVFKKVGYQTLCFSNYCTVHLNKKDCDVDCVLIMPSISVSDKCRIEYLLNLDIERINNSFVNTTFFFIIATDKQMESFYEEKIKRLGLASKVRYYIYPININKLDDELTEVDV